MSAKTLAISVVIGATLGKQYFSTFDSAQQKAVKLGSALADTNKKLGATKAVAKYGALLKELRAKQQSSASSSKRLAEGITAVERKYKTAKREAKGYGFAVGDAVRQQERLTQESKRLEKRLDSLSRAQGAKNRLSAIKGRALGAVGGAFGVSRVIGNAFSIQDKTVRLHTVVNSSDIGASIKKSVRHAVKFAQNSLATEGQILDIEYSLNSAGLSASAARAGSEIVSKLATVTHGDAEDVGVIVGDTFNNFQRTLSGTVNEKMQKIGNILLKTQERFSIKDFGQLGEGLKEAAAAAAVAHVPLTQMAAAVGALNSAGLKGSQAGTGFTELLSKLTVKAKDLGITIKKTTDGQVDFIATMAALKNRLPEVGDSTKQLAFLQKKLGLQAGKAAGALVNNMQSLKSGYAFVSSKNNKLATDYKLFTNSASGQWKMLVQNVSLLGNVLGGTLLPAIKPVVKFGSEMIGFIVKGIAKFPVIGEIIGGLAAGFIVYAGGLGLVTAAQWAWNAALVSNYTSLIKTVTGTLWAGAVWTAGAVKVGVMTAAQWLWNAALTANPIGLVIAGIAAFAALAVTVYKNWQPIKNFFADLWGGIEKQAKKVLNFVGDTFHSIKSFFGFDDAPEKQIIGKHKTIKAAILGAAISAPVMALPAFAANQPAVPVNHNNQQYNIIIHQLPGESADDLAQRVIDKQKEASLREETDVR